ncbi:thiol reductase thioredoxin, partial [Lactobacillus crispatus]
MQPKKETKVKIIAVSCAMIFLLFIGVIGFN